MSTLPVVPAPSSAPKSPSKPRRLTSGLVLVQHEGFTGPVIYCECCGKHITKASEGAVVWSESLKEGQRRRPIFLCKGEDHGYTTCLNSPEYRRLPWEQLDGFLGHLLWNTGIRSVAAYRAIAAQSERSELV